MCVWVMVHGWRSEDNSGHETWQQAALSCWTLTPCWWRCPRTSSFSFSRFKEAASVCKVFALCICLVSCMVTLGTSPPSLPVVRRRKGTQMTRAWSTGLHGTVSFYFSFCKCAKQIPTFTTGAADRMRLRLPGTHFPQEWDLQDGPFPYTCQENCYLFVFFF